MGIKVHSFESLHIRDVTPIYKWKVKETDDHTHALEKVCRRLKYTSMSNWVLDLDVTICLT